MRPVCDAREPNNLAGYIYNLLGMLQHPLLRCSKNINTKKWPMSYTNHHTCSNYNALHAYSNSKYEVYTHLQVQLRNRYSDVDEWLASRRVGWFNTRVALVFTGCCTLHPSWISLRTQDDTECENRSCHKYVGIPTAYSNSYAGSNLLETKRAQTLYLLNSYRMPGHHAI